MPILSAKEKAAFWERQKEMEREMDMREIREYEETQRLLDEGVVGFLPEKISNRMLQRIVSRRPLITSHEPRLGGGGVGGYKCQCPDPLGLDLDCPVDSCPSSGCQW